jgi:hypothetical protein
MKSRLAVTNVRFGSEADILAAISDVRFTPNSDRESEFSQKGHVCFTPESGHVRCDSLCLLWAKSGHSPLKYFVGAGEQLRW